MATDFYHGVAVLVIAGQLEADVPYETVGRLLQHDGWVDVVQTIRRVYPQAYAAMCAQHHAAIQDGIQAFGYKEVEQ